MLVNITDRSGELVDFEVAVNLSESLLLGREGSFAPSAKFKGCYAVADNKIIVNGKIYYTANLVCDRCGAPVTRDFVTEVSASYATAPDSEELLCDGNKFDITIPINESIILGLPMQVLCNEDCKGLCVECGINLNLQTCKCKEKDNTSSPFFGLKEKFSVGGADNGSTKTKNIKTKTQQEIR